MITIYDIAEECGVSPATVSRVINMSPVVSAATRNKVMLAIEKLGYSIPEKTANAGRIILFVSNVSDPNISNAGYTAISDAGYQMLFFYCGESKNTGRDLLQFLDSDIAGSIAAVVLLNAGLYIDRETESRLNRYPVLQLMTRNTDLHRSVSAIIDYHHAYYMAAQHLLDLGCSSICMFTSSEVSENNTAGQDVSSYASGFRSALFENGKIPGPDSIIECDFTTEGCYEATLSHMRSCAVRPDAFICPVDSMAVGCLRAVYDIGLSCPENVRVMSMMSDYYSSYTTPSISTLHIPYEAMFRDGIRCITQMIGDASIPSQVLLFDYELDYKESTEGMSS